MLVLNRKLGERIVIGDQIVITVVSISSDRIRLGVSAPGEVPIYREEVLNRMKGSDQTAALSGPDRLPSPLEYV